MLPTSPATNCWTSAEEGVADSIVSKVSTHKFLGVEDEAAARLGNVWFDAFPDPEDGESYSDDEWDALFPAILIGTPGDDASALVGNFTASPNMWTFNGVIEVQFQDSLRADDHRTPVHEQERIFKNGVGDILVELTDDVHEHTFITDLMLMAYGRSSNKNEVALGPLQIAIVHLKWGINAGR